MGAYQDRDRMLLGAEEIEFRSIRFGKIGAEAWRRKVKKKKKKKKKKKGHGHGHGSLH
jgi:hypothetical protein